MTFSDILKNTFYILFIVILIQPFITSIKKMYEKSLHPTTKVGYLEMQGVILDSAGYVKQLKKYFKDEEIKAILFKMDADGGVAGSSEVIFHEIMEMKKEYPKPLVVLIENMCASGAYWIACAADHIIASPVAWIGNIGVTIPYRFKFNKLINQYNVQYEPVKAGEYKEFLNQFVETKPNEKVMLQSLVDQSYQEFTESVASRRSKLSLNKVNDWANGKVFTGRQALEMVLIDELGSKTNAIVWIKDKALIDGKIEWVKPPQRSMLSNFFMQEEEDSSDVSASATSQIADAVTARIEKRLFGKKHSMVM